MTEHHTREHASNPHQDREEAVLERYLEDLRNRVGEECFEVVVRAVQDACRRLNGEGQVLLDVPGEDGWTPGLQRECLSLLAVMITGKLDHHLIERPGPGRSTGWLVVQADTEHSAPASPPLPPQSDPAAQPPGNPNQSGIQSPALQGPNMTLPPATHTYPAAMVDTGTRALIERIVTAVRDGQDQQVQELITAFATVAAGPADLYLLHARLRDPTAE
ncbi:hypothetical protein OTB20_17250 [Streptomyces sp. H27-H1]|uniref:hypothetical protein n=1 Tax=Streptomyces sp. H27-H1 TaxID=2996461 RepID=UPI00226DA687|nr:hypothetical protein [Streptomyces sp. H27-H1]MCY0927926.1 hypothetical protein [Streptomyces sp. H27-H1]